RGLDSVDPIPPFGNIEIDLDRARLRPSLAQDERHADLDAFADGGTAGPQKQIFRGLHGDGRGPSAWPTFAHAAQNFVQRAPIDAVILAEATVLRVAPRT